MMDPTKYAEQIKQLGAATRDGWAAAADIELRQQFYRGANALVETGQAKSIEDAFLIMLRADGSYSPATAYAFLAGFHLHFTLEAMEMAAAMDKQQPN
jgi:hypothetical protein